MSKFVGYAAISIDGKISTAPDKKPSWTSPEDWAFFQSELEKVDAVIVGYNTYKLYKENLDKRNSFVFTKSVTELEENDEVIFVNPEHTNLKELLKNYETIAVLGGSYVYQYCLEHDMLDEFYITIEPIMLGSGIPLFNGGDSKRLRLIESKSLNENGTLLLKYSCT